MSHAATYLRYLVSPIGLFKTQKELAEQACMNPSSVFAAMNATTHIKVSTLEKILRVLPDKEQDELIANVIRDTLPAAYWSKALSSDGGNRIVVHNQELPRPIEGMFQLLRLKALTEKRVLQMLETMAGMLGFAPS